MVDATGGARADLMLVHPDNRVYLRKPWKQTLEDLCSWRQERIEEGCDRWPGTVVVDKRERMLGKWLANQRSYRKLMDANPRNRKGLKGMCPERVRLLDARLPGWMGSEPNERVLVEVYGRVDGEGSTGDAEVYGRDAVSQMDAYASMGSASRDTNDSLGKNNEPGLTRQVAQPVWHLRASFDQSLERTRIWRLHHPDRWPNHQDRLGDVEEARVYRWLIEQRRYKRNFDAGKKTKLGGMCEERLRLMNEVIGSDWAIGNRPDVDTLPNIGTKQMRNDAGAGKKRPRMDGPRMEKGNGAMRGEESSGLNYMASLASHEMDAMRQAQQQQHALHQQVMHAARYSHGYGVDDDGQQYHSTQQRIQQLAHAQGLRQVNSDQV